MSLENKIEALTVAVTVLTEVLSRAATTPTAEVLEKAAGIVTDVVAKAPKAPKVRTAPAAADSPPSETVGASAASEPSATSHEPVGYDEVKSALIAVSEKHGRQLAVDCLSRLGVAKALELDPSRYAAAVALFVKALESGRV